MLLSELLIRLNPGWDPEPKTDSVGIGGRWATKRHKLGRILSSDWSVGIEQFAK